MRNPKHETNKLNLEDGTAQLGALLKVVTPVVTLARFCCCPLWMYSRAHAWLDLHDQVEIENWNLDRDWQSQISSWLMDLCKADWTQGPYLMPQNMIAAAEFTLRLLKCFAFVMCTFVFNSNRFVSSGLARLRPKPCGFSHLILLVQKCLIIPYCFEGWPSRYTTQTLMWTHFPFQKQQSFNQNKNHWCHSAHVQQVCNQPGQCSSRHEALSNKNWKTAGVDKNCNRFKSWANWRR